MLEGQQDGRVDLVAVEGLPPPLVLFFVEAGGGLESHLVVEGSYFGLVEVVVLAGKLGLPPIGSLAVAHQSKYYNTLIPITLPKNPL